LTKLILYVKNLGIALWHIPLALIGKYQYNPKDPYFQNLAIVALDLLGNTLLGGDPNETISSRSAKAQAHEQQENPPSYGWGCRMCSFLAVFQENHCEKALQRNVGSRAVVPDESTSIGPST
jgi:hypothetical protein